jgi:sec-independent protein translocase protein TatA
MSTSILAFGGLGPVELIVILLVALLVFGRRLPEVARSMGQGLMEFRRGLRDDPRDAPRPLPDASAEGEEEKALYPEIAGEEAEEGGDAPEDDAGDEPDTPAG